MSLEIFPARDEPQKVFVYGTLKKGYGNHDRHLREAKDLGTAALPGIMFHLGHFPAICTEERFSMLAGEVYECTWDQIFKMDILEGVKANFYTRIQVDVKPHGKVWTYVFTRDKVLDFKEDKVIISGVWRGIMSPTVKWLGFGKGVEVGRFEANMSHNEIKIADGKGDYTLRRDEAKNAYVLINKASGEALGEYKYLRDMTGLKPTIRLPPKVVEPTITTPTVHPTVQDIMAGRARAYPATTPNSAITVSNPKEETVQVVSNIPQAAKFFGVKYHEA